ncbi:MAG: glycosyltransferase family 2 protein [Bacteroidetes bacterium]|nr:glycosyltransferase family 2 protein [Bacteroidota bacterium]
MELSIIIPVYNESDNIIPMFERIEATMDRLKDKFPASSDYEVVYVNDGSTDDSLIAIMNLVGSNDHVGYINFSRNFGHQIAVSAGLDHVRGKAVVIIDGDLQDPPELIEELFTKWEEGYEVVYAQRTVRQGEGIFKKVSAKMFYKLITKITSVEIPVDTGDFRLVDQKIVDVLRNMPEKNKFLRGQIAWTGFRQIGVPYEREARHKGETGYPFRVMLRFALDGITAFSHLPLKIATWTGFIAFMFAIGMIIYALYAQFTGGTVQGWTSTIILVAFIGGLQLFCLGIIGEYIIRLITNIRNRPLYIIESSNVIPKYNAEIINLERKEGIAKTAN